MLSLVFLLVTNSLELRMLHSYAQEVDKSEGLNVSAGSNSKWLLKICKPYVYLPFVTLCDNKFVDRSVV